MPEKKYARRQFLKQSSLATVIAAAGTAVAAPQPEEPSDADVTSNQGAVAGYELSDRQLDSLSYSLSSYDQINPKFTFTATNKAAARAWQKASRIQLVNRLGGFPTKRCALRPQVLETVQFPSYTREKIIFQSRENLTVFGYLLLPKKLQKPSPAIICLPGHGRGCDDIVGLSEDGKQRDNKAGYAKDFALQCVENGYAALAIEQLGFGCRRDEAARKRGQGQSSCQPAAGAALLFGQTMIGWRVWDVMRAIDYLQTRSEIDSQRLATMGISGGGTISLFSAALDTRIKVAVVSGYFNTFRHSIVSLSHCIDNYVPGLLNDFEMYDLAGLIAPRFLFTESGTRDPIFPPAGSREAYNKARHIYEVFGVTENLGHEIFEGEHVFNGKGAFEFLQKWL